MNEDVNINDNDIKNKIKELDSYKIHNEYTKFQKEGILPSNISNKIIYQSNLDELDPTYMDDDDNN